MPRMSPVRAEVTRARVLDAVRSCVDRHGPHGTTMEMIIAESGLSTGTVYRYIGGKDEGIAAAVTASLRQIAEPCAAVLRAEPLPSPPETVRRLLDLVDGFSRRPDHSLVRVAVHGLSAVASSPALRAGTSPAYRALRDLLREAAVTWRRTGALPPRADADAVASTLLSLILGCVTRQALDPRAGERARAATVRTVEALYAPGGTAAPPLVPRPVRRTAPPD
ncbi:TetR/AcrR family transcriptional regulator [Streptomyces sp. NPDC091281]|uniref:TetR/AcrR family transcriptional regulator n=1 Tax=Streptomyces sp. NPDC091281 TaxID=3365985 RepID=UPI0037FC04AA